MKIDTIATKKKITDAYVPYREAVKNFRPKFGSDRDISIVRRIQEIDEMKESVKQKIDSAKGGEALAERLVRAMESVVEQLSNHEGA